MIAFIEGALVQAGREAVVAVGGGGLALEVHLSERSAAGLPAVGEGVRLWTHLAVREDAWVLYGFLERQERAMFRLLVSVSGVGPRVALGMLSAAGPQEIARCLRSGDERSLARLPGIGKKSAARLVVELGQRVPPTLGQPDADAAPAAAGRGDGILAEALQVLQAMGLPAGQAESLLRRTGRSRPELTGDAPAWVRAVLGQLDKPGR